MVQGQDSVPEPSPPGDYGPHSGSLGIRMSTTSSTGGPWQGCVLAACPALSAHCAWVTCPVPAMPRSCRSQTQSVLGGAGPGGHGQGAPSPSQTSTINHKKMNVCRNISQPHACLLSISTKRVAFISRVKCALSSLQHHLQPKSLPSLISF